MHMCARARMQACALTHTYVPKVVYRICCRWFPYANCQTINPAEKVFINLIKLIHNLIIRSSLIRGKSTFYSFDWSIKSISNSNLNKVSEQIRGNIQIRDTALKTQITSITVKMSFQGIEYSELSQATFCT